VEGLSSVVLAFNDAINRRDVGRLGELMTPDHAFIDSEGTVVSGRGNALGAWRGFFEAYPDYRNVWTEVTAVGEVQVATGRSVCPSEPELDGPALWTAKTRGERISEWRVYDDTPDIRARLGISE
jgi:ketosteroid isomerase-like protein